MSIRSTHRSAARRRVASAPSLGAVLLVVFALFGCQSSPNYPLAPGLSGMRTEMTVVATTTLGPYQDATLDMAGKTIHAYVMPSPACADVFTKGESVDYVDNGPMGIYRRGDARCQGMGVGNLIVWRNRSEHSSGGPLPTTQAAFRVIHKGDEYALLRGQFPGARRIGFTGDNDIVAVIPVTGECSRIPDQRAATMQYQDNGSPAYALMGPSGLCVIEGFAQPPPQVATPDSDMPDEQTGSGFNPDE
jgi:hypothetical protein